ncbi:MAG: deoxyguanosinetriphosphate triphosphohydrolase family protein [Planctomycetota bacterium]|jgi:dGTPase
MASSLAPYAVTFERDRDRVIHCAAFRRLEGKTQVFTTGLNDQYRTRLTHSIEVAQIGRTIARVLDLNEPLTEAICLAHDLGHAPFGHNGEGVLNGLMKDHRGFEHNRQSLRIVDFIERPYPDFAGLNLMFETRLGLMKHSSPYDKPESVDNWPEHPSLEGQIADIADRIAYNCHDLEDGLRSRLIDEQACEKVQMEAISDTVVRRTRLAKTMIDILASDVIETGKTNLKNANIEDLEQVFSHSKALVNISEGGDAALQELEAFLMQKMYLHPTLAETTENLKCF